jgi:hypothetical protein
MQGIGRECFDHSELGRFDITAMREVAPQIGTLIGIDLDCIHDHIRDNYVWEEERVLNLPDESWQNDPGIVLVFMEDGVLTHCVVDGTHRVIRRHRERCDNMTFWEIPLEKAIRPGMEWGVLKTHNWGPHDIVNGKKVTRQ